MQNFRFLLQKMEVEEASPISYSLVSAQGDARIDLTAMLGKRIHLQYHGDTECLNCGRTDRIFSQGFCYLCHQTSPESSDCILRPELCRGHLGLGRDARFEFEQHAQPHFVYVFLRVSLLQVAEAHASVDAVCLGGAVEPPASSCRRSAFAHDCIVRSRNL